MAIVFELKNSRRAASAASVILDIRSLGPRRTLVLLGGHALNDASLRHLSSPSTNLRRFSMQTPPGDVSPLSGFLRAGRGIAAGLGAALLSTGAIAQTTSDNSAPAQL